MHLSSPRLSKPSKSSSFQNFRSISSSNLRASMGGHSSSSTSPSLNNQSMTSSPSPSLHQLRGRSSSFRHPKPNYQNVGLNEKIPDTIMNVAKLIYESPNEEFITEDMQKFLNQILPNTSLYRNGRVSIDFKTHFGELIMKMYIIIH